MSLADRLQKAQQKDRIAEVRIRVQERLVESLGPRLYDATLSDTELEGMVLKPNMVIDGKKARKASRPAPMTSTRSGSPIRKARVRWSRQ